MALISRFQALSPAERKELVETLFNADMRSAEAKTALKLMQAVLEEHKALSEELSKLGTYIRQAYSSTLEGQSYSLEQVTHFSLSSLPMVPCRALRDCKTPFQV